MGIEIIPGITLRGNVKQITTFKSLLSGNGIDYDKTKIINLETRKI